MGWLSRMFGFRWSLYIVRGSDLLYAMHENSVVRIVGYVMPYFANGGRPVSPWSLHLNFNKNHQSFELRPEHFTAAGSDITALLLDTIRQIDPGWRVRGGEPVFVDAITKKQLKLSHSIDYSDLQAAAEALGKAKDPTFHSVMREVFGR